MSEDKVDSMFRYGAKLLASLAAEFMQHGVEAGMTPADTLLLFCSLLIAKASAIIRVLIPGEETLEIVLDMVRDEWASPDLEKPNRGMN